MPDSALDHLVVNARFDLDAAQSAFDGLGFTLTPRGRHSLGSINHLVMFARGYLELIGLPRGTDRLRQEILDSPLGIDGLVLASADADATQAAWAAAGFALQPVQHFSRRVEIDGEPREARFSTVRLQPGQFKAGRVYACRQHTPELLWRPEWIAHPNRVQGIAALVVVGRDPAQLQRDYRRLGEPDADFALEFTDRAGFARRYGALAAHAPQPQDDFFGAIRLRGGELQALAQRALRLGLPAASADGRLTIALPALRTLLEFVP